MKFNILPCELLNVVSSTHSLTLEDCSLKFDLSLGATRQFEVSLKLQRGGIDDKTRHDVKQHRSRITGDTFVAALEEFPYYNKITLMHGSSLVLRL